MRVLIEKISVNTIRIIALCTALSFGLATPVAAAYTSKHVNGYTKEEYCDKLIYELRDNAFRVKQTEQYIKDVVTDKATKEKALKATARSLRGLDKLIKLTLMVKQNPVEREGGHNSEFEGIVDDIVHGKGYWFANYEDLRNMSIDLMHQTVTEIRDITGINGDIGSTLYNLLVDRYRFKTGGGGLGPIN
jgi:hypothetical protein